MPFKYPINTIAYGSAATSDNLNAPLNDIQSNLDYLEVEKEALNNKVDTFLGTPGNEALDSLSEIVNALGDNPNLAATLEHIRPDVIVGNGSTPGVSHTEANFVSAINSAGGTLNKILLLPDVTFTANREITESVRLMMATPETYINIGATETTFSGEVDGELNVNGSGTINISGLAKGLKINTQGSPTINFTLPGSAGCIFVDGRLWVAGRSSVPPQPATDKSNKIASTAFVKKVVVDNLTDSSTDRPVSANMGRELQNTKAPLGSPALTGTPTAPTATSGDNPTQIATTTFVHQISNTVDSKISIQATSEDRTPSMIEVDKLFKSPYPNANLPTLLNKIQAPVPGEDGRFSYSVAISDDRIVVGANLEDSTASEAGSAYVYDAKGILIKKIQASGIDPFRSSLAISGDWIVRGASWDNTKGTKAGSAYICDSNGENIQKIQPSDLQAYDRFGYSVAISSNRFVVGAYHEDAAANAAGSVYVYKLNGTLIKKIQISDPEHSKYFGFSVAISGNRIVVGASSEDTTGGYTGSAYIYDSDGNFIKNILSSDPQASDNFGHSVAISGNRIVVGARYEDTTAPGAGSAYIYDANGNFIKKIHAYKPEESDVFGRSVAISGDRIVVGAYREDTIATEASSAYIYDSNGNFIQKIQAPDSQFNGRFGYSVAICSDRIVVGALYEDTTAFEAGSTYIYQIPHSNGSTPSFSTKIQLSDPQKDDRFGHSISISGNRIVVGAIRDDTSGPDSGAAYIYSSEGDFIGPIQAVNPDIADYFGCSVAISGDRIVVGAKNKDSGALSNTGAAYIYNSNGIRIKEILAFETDSHENNRFGGSVAISGDRIVVGATGESSTEKTGSAYIFDSNGNPQKKIKAPEPEPGDEFGKAVAIAYNRIVIASKREVTAESSYGVVYVFDADGKPIQMIQANDPNADESFGNSLAISGDRIVVGGAVNTKAGSAYIYDLNGAFINKIQAFDPEKDDSFGNSVAISGNRIVVGACREGAVTSNGRVYVFDSNGNAIQKIQAPDFTANDCFGYSVGISGDKIVIGAYKDSQPIDRAGSAYIYQNATNNLMDIARGWFGKE